MPGRPGTIQEEGGRPAEQAVRVKAENKAAPGRTAPEQAHRRQAAQARAVANPRGKAARPVAVLAAVVLALVAVLAVLAL